MALWALAVFAAGVLSAVLAILRHRTMSLIRIGGSYRLNRLLVRHATDLGATLTRRVGAGQLATLGLSDVGAASTSLTVTGPGVGAVVAGVVIAVLLLQVSGVLALVVLVGVPVLVLVVGPVMSRLIASQDAYRTEQGRLTADLVDATAGVRVLNAFGGKAPYQRRFTTTSQSMLGQGYRVAAVTSWVDAVAVGLPALFLAVVTWLAARLVAEEAISPGQLVAVYGYAAALVQPVSALIEGGGMLGRGVVAARRMIAFLSLRPADDAGDAGGAPQQPGFDPGLDPGLDPDPGPALGPTVLRDPVTGLSVAPGAFVGLVCDSTEAAELVLRRLGGLEPADVAPGDRDPRAGALAAPARARGGGRLDDLRRDDR